MNERPRPASPSRVAGSCQPEPAPTVDLIARARSGDAAARETLAERCLPPLRRWARGRLPAVAQGEGDPGELVQGTIVSVLARLDTFQAADEGALQAQLRQAVAQRIADGVRRQRGPRQTDGPAPLDAPAPSPLDQAVGAQNVARYDAALARLADRDRHAVIGRLELQYSYEQLAEALGTPTAGAARAAVIRAMGRLALEMQSLTG